MKNLLILFLVFSLRPSFGQKEATDLKLEGVNKTEVQLFQLDTTKILVIKGKYGTEIAFNRDDFDVSNGQKITMELMEFYDPDLKLPINILSNENETIQSSGKIYLNFKAENKRLALLKNKRLAIKFLDKIKKENTIYYAKLDSTNQYKWVEEEVYVGIMRFNVQYQIDELITVPIDSLDSYLKISNQIMLPLYALYSLDSTTFPPIRINKFGWINIGCVK